ncbi:MAG TPA: GtrA family protein, partial [Candidatus Sulfotelmatobacter sp.]|nr:GtrA family protein [Candidatus Sulfotelmatobacter sp.]
MTITTTTPLVLSEVEMRKSWAHSGERRGTRDILLRWLKFNLVGGIGIAVQFAALFVLKGIFHFNYLAATALAVEAAVVHNFVWHEQFTWSDRVQASWRRSLPRFARF